MNTNNSDIHITTWSGPWSPISGNIQFTQISNSITLLIPNVEANSTTCAIIQADTLLPDRLRPVIDVWQDILVRDDSDTDNSLGHVVVKTDGSILVYADKYNNAFTGGQSNTGFKSFTIAYPAVRVQGKDY